LLPILIFVERKKKKKEEYIEIKDEEKKIFNEISTKTDFISKKIFCYSAISYKKYIDNKDKREENIFDFINKKKKSYFNLKKFNLYCDIYIK
jgi:hypothetical protein